MRKQKFSASEIQAMALIHCENGISLTSDGRRILNAAKKLETRGIVKLRHVHQWRNPHSGIGGSIFYYEFTNGHPLFFKGES